MSRRALVVFAAAALACGGHHKVSGVPPEQFAIVVVNHHWLDVRVYVVHDGQRTPIGSVTATATEQFDVSTRLLGSQRQISLMGEAVGSAEVVSTELITVQVGQYVEWTLENALRRSSVAVY
jgi:hypothetical protein